MPNVLYNIGNTPMIKINNIVKADGIKCDLRTYHELLLLSFSVCVGNTPSIE